MQHSYSSPEPVQPPAEAKKTIQIPQVILYAALGLVALYLLYYLLPTSITSFIPSPFAKKSTITVIGTGSVKAVPDKAGFAVTIADTGADSNLALASAKQKVEQLKTMLKGQGVTDEDIQIASFSVTPAATGENNVVYAAGTTMIISTKNLLAADSLVSIVLAQGGNLTIPLTYTVSDRELLETQARERAITDAEAKAKDVASSFNRPLGKMVSYTETQSQTSQTTESSSIQGTAGEITISQAVQVTYKTK